MNTATQIRRSIQAIALRMADRTIDRDEAVKMDEKLWRRARSLGLTEEVNRQLGLVARGRLV